MAGEPAVKNDDLAGILEPETDDTKTDDSIAKPGDGEVDADKDTKTDDETGKETPKEKTAEELAAERATQLEDNNRELRQLLRSQKRDLDVLRAKLDRVEKRSAAATKVVDNKTDDDIINLLAGEDKVKTKDETPVADELSPLELAQNELAAIAEIKGPILDTLLETMEMNPKYGDIREVCSQNNFNDIFDAVGNAIAEKEGRDPVVASLEAEAAVWKMSNPYKYMYDLIKKHHPSYAGKTETPPTKTEDKKDKTEPPISLANVPGKGSPTNAWTSARIDEMDEMELDKVPPEIYERYLRGDLD